jgi:hypothetical protein
MSCFVLGALGCDYSNGKTNFFWGGMNKQVIQFCNI